MQGLFPLCREQFDSTCKICLGHKSNCAFLSDQHPLPDGQGLPGLKGVWGYIFGQEKLVTSCQQVFYPGLPVRLAWCWKSLRIHTWQNGRLRFVFEGKTCVINGHLCSQINLLHCSVALLLASLCKAQNSIVFGAQINHITKLTQARKKWTVQQTYSKCYIEN